MHSLNLSGKIPILKKKISSFLSKEDGKITKSGLIKAGVAVALFSMGAAMSSQKVEAKVTCPTGCGITIPDPIDSSKQHTVHANSMSLSTTSSSATGTHNHCAETCHASHASHGSHGSHGSHCNSWIIGSKLFYD